MNSKTQDHPSDTRKTTVFAVGGGKGGVGKTVISASLGVGLAQLGKRIVVVDADLAGANLHVVLGIRIPTQTSSRFLNHEQDNLEELLVDHPNFDNLKLLSAPIGSMGAGNISFSQKEKFIRHITKFDADFIIMDLGAGNSYNVLDFFLAADQGILIVNPDPLSFLEVYNFIKLALFRRIALEVKSTDGALGIIREAARTETHRSQMFMSRFYNTVRSLDTDVAEQIETIVSEFRPMLLINMLNEPEDEAKVHELKNAVLEILAVEVDYLGAVRRDEMVRKSVGEMRPFISYDVKSPASRDLATVIITDLLQYNKIKSLRKAYALRKRLTQKEEPTPDDAICSVKCMLWKDCAYKKGGYPCELMHLSWLNRFKE